jgi:hypothetical protein
MKKSQLKRVEDRLKQCGEISRNDCIRNFITRLSAIIQVLEEKGYEFETFSRNGDYVYKLVK